MTAPLLEKIRMSPPDSAELSPSVLLGQIAVAYRGDVNTSRMSEKERTQVAFENRACQNPDYDPMWWFPTPGNHRDARRAIDICCQCPAISVAWCAEQGKTEPVGIRAGVWIDQVTPFGQKKCHKCKRVLPEDRFDEWGENDRRSKKCQDCAAKAAAAAKADAEAGTPA